MPSRYNGWPILVGSDSLNVTPTWTQTLARTLAQTFGQGTPPPDDGPIDTGWIDCPLESGIQARPGPYQPQVRRVPSGMVFFRGHFSNDGLPAGSTTLAKVPDAFKPEMEVRWIGFVTSQASRPIGGWISAASGDIVVQSYDTALPVAHFCIIAPPWEAA